MINWLLVATTQHGCLHDVIDMSCPDDGLVFIVTASFGQYASACDDECCVPDAANDCTELMKDYNDVQWANLKLACNYNSVCLFQHTAHMMTSCPEQKVADYMTITYVCSNGKGLIAKNSFFANFCGYFSTCFVTLSNLQSIFYISIILRVDCD